MKKSCSSYTKKRFDDSDRAMVQVTGDGKIVRINQAFTALMGYTSTGILGKRFPVLLYNDEEMIRRAMSGPMNRLLSSEADPMEIIMYHQDGREVPVRLHAVIERDGISVTNAVGIIESLAASGPAKTQPLDLRQTMLEAQHNFETVLNYTADAIVLGDISGNITTANDAYLRLIGYQREEVLGRHIVEFTAINPGSFRDTLGDEVIVDDAYLAMGAKAVAACFENGSYQWELHLVNRNNLLVPCEFNMSILKDQNGERRGSIIIARDITKRRKAEREIAIQTRELRKSKEQFEYLINASLDPIMMSGLSGKLLFFNQAFCDMLGFSPEELSEKTVHSFTLAEPGTYRSTTGEQVTITEEYLNEVLTHMCSAVESGGISSYERYLVRKNGELVPVIASTAFQLDEQGTAACAFDIMRDITERKKVEAELIRARETAERAGAAKAQFLANMSHEIRTPINGVIGFTDMLLDTSLDIEQEDYALTIKRSGESLLSLINDILDYSKIEAGKIELEALDFDIELLAHDACALIRPRVHRSVELLCRIGDGLPSMVSSDPYRIKQVLINLLGNAAKFTECGEIELSVDIEDEQDGCALIHSRIRDTGIGIPADKLETIFELFEQADGTTTRKFGGTGLGLAICRRIAQRLNGNVWAESPAPDGTGSLFHFTAWLKLGKKKQVRRFKSVSLSGRRALLTDDNQTNLAITTKLLRATGMQVHECDNGVAALAAVKASVRNNTPFDICILDIMMPGISGFDLARKIRALAGERLPLLAFCSILEKGGAQKCREAGFNGFLPKPISRVKLFKMLERLIGDAAGTADRSEQREMDIVTQYSMREDQKHSVSLLLAEDNKVNQKLAVAILKKANYNVEVANNGQEAVDMYCADPARYDLIFMDIQMPVLNGLEATRRIRAWECARAPESDSPPRRVPIVAMTANALTGDRDTCIEAGMDDYLSKPIKRELVFDMLQKWIFERIQS